MAKNLDVVTLFVDDLRPSPYRTNQAVARSYSEAIETITALLAAGYEILLDLDHDLGEDKTGYDICKFVVENRIPLFGYRLHSMNPVGRHNMEQLLSHYGYTNFN